MVRYSYLWREKEKGAKLLSAAAAVTYRVFWHGGGVIQRCG